MAGVRCVLVGAIAVAVAGCPAAALAAPVSGPHETVESKLTTSRPGSRTGFEYSGRYHAAGDPSADPPYMRRMTSYAPPGMVFDTTALPRCEASDLELALSGPAACPADSRLGGGTAEGKFMDQPSELVLDLFNGDHEQIIVASTPFLTTVSRGAIHPDMSIEFASPTCYPATPAGCPVDNANQISSHIEVPPRGRYLTTPPRCPRSRHWRTPIRFWWADGTIDTVVTRQPCTKRKR